MVMQQMKGQDRKTSKCRSYDLRGSSKKRGAGGKGAWGQFGDELVEAEMDRHDPCYDPVEDQRDIVVQRFVEDPFPALGGEIRLVAQEEADAMSPKGHTAVNLCD